MPSGDGALPHLRSFRYYFLVFFGTAQFFLTLTDMTDLTVIFTLYGISERVRQFLGPRVQWVAHCHQTATHFCDLFQSYLDLMERSFLQAMREEELRDSQTRDWQSYREPHEELMDVVNQHIYDDSMMITTEDARRMLYRDFGPLDSDDAMSTSSSGRWSWGS